jgi:hypothetical protein
MSSRNEGAEWTWIKGLGRALQWTIVATTILAAIMGVMAAYLPHFVLNFWLRWVIAFFVGWILFAVVHRAAGMAGGVCTAIVLVAAAAVFMTQHFVFAECGVTLTSGKIVSGEVWLEPATIASVNVSTFLGLVIATMLCHDGAGIWQTVAGILSGRVRG